ncbi:2-oxoacid:acceptor oxidoreductase subunit alpha [Stutzerimonas stutzeri]|uniref:2-oxoacid:acceptor oxidoreductase subunit alpha n=1 Tax=Stutzerimonas stutzeri TaxID=316 RepID=UPI002449C35C|nr:2-oxoacid:acceptor oxidoreductase subunit alpha [Stutzerimonas stutzeri]MDH0425449.1 2-oxoacid:acceptor oxidoreductase subunit alpha [Stutzerimonas stutzeri]
MHRQQVSIVLAGSGGAGVLTAGSLLLEAAAAVGWYGLMTRSLGPQIRGGEAAAMIRLGEAPVACHGDRFDVVVALDWHNIERFTSEIPMDAASVLVGDPAEGEAPARLLASGPRVAMLPIAELLKTVPKGRANMVALGAVAEMIGLPVAAILDVLVRQLAHKGQSAIDASAKALAAGQCAAAAFPPVTRLVAGVPQGTRWSISGNQAAALGALRCGVRFVAGYPITPATDMLEWLARELPKVGGVVVQVEDELASINQIIGASYGGVPALTATSGPGLSLMAESLGLAIAAEIPLVVVNVMRVGPSTGIATKSEQTDLNLAVYGQHGEAPHLVTAPLSVADCLFTMQWTLYLAEALQTPAILLSDQTLAQAQAIIPRPADVHFLPRREVALASVEGQPRYQRYALTGSGVSPMAIPGTPGCMHVAEGLEHNAAGRPSSLAEDHQAQMDKRLRKLTGFDYGEHWAAIDGPADAPFSIVTWGSSTEPVREAVVRLRERGIVPRLIALRLISPARPEQFAKALAGIERMLIVEQSHSGQLHRYLRAHYELPGEVRMLLQPGPLVIRPGAVLQRLEGWI